MRASIVIASVFVMGGLAHAQPTSQDKAAADAAFTKGKSLMDAGKCDEAVPQFAKSQELDPQLGTQYNLALCYEKLGQLASAWGEFNELAAKDSNKKRKADSAKRLKAIAPRLTRMAIKVAEPVDGLVIQRDGVDVTALVDVETPVDPGVSQFDATAPGYGSWHAEVDLTAEGETVSIDVPPLIEDPVVVDDGTGDDTVLVDDGKGGTVRKVAPPPKKPAKPGKMRKILGLSMAGVGVIVTGVGGYFGLQAMGLTSDAEETCGGSLSTCSGDVVVAQDQIDEAREQANLSNLFVGAGLVVATVGVVLWLTAPDGGGEERSSALVPVVGPDGFGLVLDRPF